VNIKASLLLVPLFVLATSCSSAPPVKPSASNVKVSREAPAKDCEDLGMVNGRVKSSTGNFEEAIEDLKLDAARLGGNYVQMGITGGMGKSVNGRAYLCH
jgi:hypothetical protein